MVVTLSLLTRSAILDGRGNDAVTSGACIDCGGMEEASCCPSDLRLRCVGGALGSFGFGLGPRFLGGSLALAASSSGVRIFFLGPLFFGAGAGSTRELKLEAPAGADEVGSMGAEVRATATPELFPFWRFRLGGDGNKLPGCTSPGESGGLLKGSEDAVERTESSNRCT